MLEEVDHPEDWAVDDPDLREPPSPVPRASVDSAAWSTTETPAQRFTFTELQPVGRDELPHRVAGGRCCRSRTACVQTPNGLSVTHAVEVSGPLALVFGPLVGRKIAAGLPAVVRLVTTNAARRHGADARGE